MTTSPLPWTTKVQYQPHEGPPVTSIYDQSGRYIGVFFDSRDAELVLEAVNPSREPMPECDLDYDYE